MKIYGRTLAMLAGGLLVAVTAFSPRVHGGEPGCECPASGKCVGVPMLSKLPYINRLFRNVGIAAEDRGCEEVFELLGVDFEVQPGTPLFIQVSGTCALKEGEKACAGEFLSVCPVAKATCETAACKASTCDAAACKTAACKTAACTDAATCTVSTTKSCTACTAGKCPTECAATKCASECAGTQTVAVCTKECASATAACCSKGKCPAQDLHVSAKSACESECEKPVCLGQTLMTLAGEKARLEAKLEAQAEAFELKSKLIEGYAELAAERAKLEAKVELQEERNELLSEMLELAAENAKLKATNELAEMKAALMHETLKVTIENQQLKAQVAELTEKTGVGQPTIRTSKRAKAGMTTR